VKRPIWIGSAALAATIALTVLRARRRMDLREKVVLITGGSRGLGLALARAFAARGSHLVLCARSADELEWARRDLSGSHGFVLTFVCDVTDQEQVNALIAKVVDQFGHIDVLVNNAGTISVGPFHTMSIEDFEYAMDVMFWGMVYATLAALPHFRRRGCGHIVNITSIGGKVSVPHLLPYSCAKFAAVAFSEGLCAELNGSGVRVVTIAPGLMRTGSHVNALFKGAEEGEAAWFSAGASLPGISMSAKRAARQIIQAMEQGRTERILSTPANLLARFHGLFPELSVAVLGFVNRLLPRGSQRVEVGSESLILQRPWMRAVTTLGRRAAREYLQPAADLRTQGG
jgi:short-subunit dehydrogenase